jgi:hypothetical protein
MITIPVAVNNAAFKWQVELWWWNHQITYGAKARDKAFLILMDKNYRDEEEDSLSWIPPELPYALCKGVWAESKHHQLYLPLNIQIGLRQIIGRFVNDEVLEVVDCDLFHFRHHPKVEVCDNTLIVCDLYEKWHLKSLTTNKHVIEPYFENRGRYYNGGFVPIIGKAGTFKKLLYEWEAVHRDIMTRTFDQSLIHWWGGMFALQAACEKAKITMIAEDWCFIPGANQLSDSHYVGHYCCDNEFFLKKDFPFIDLRRFPPNIYYDRLKAWVRESGYKTGNYILD